MSLDESISSLIGHIYESVDDPVQWERVLREVKDQFNACCVLQTVSDLRHRELSRSIFFGSGTAAFVDGVKEYAEGSYLEDPSFQWAVQHPTARFCDTSEIIPARDYLEQPFIQWNRKVIGSTHWVVGYTAPEGDLTFSLSVHPTAEVGPLPGDQKKLFKLIFEHMDRAIRLATRPVRCTRDEEAYILIDRSGCVSKINSAAQEVVDARDGLEIWDRQLIAPCTPSAHRLNDALRSALSALHTGDFGGAVSLARPSGKRDLLLTVTPLLNELSPFEAFRPAALVRIIDPEAQIQPSAVNNWSALFGLSPAEARFAKILMSGDQNLRHAANELNITYETARVHLKKLLEKTDTHSQSQLSRLLTRVETHHSID